MDTSTSSSIRDGLTSLLLHSLHRLVLRLQTSKEWNIFFNNWEGCFGLKRISVGAPHKPATFSWIFGDKEERKWIRNPGRRVKAQEKQTKHVVCALLGDWWLIVLFLHFGCGSVRAAGTVPRQGRGGGAKKWDRDGKQKEWQRKTKIRKHFPK